MPQNLVEIYEPASKIVPILILDLNDTKKKMKTGFHIKKR